ncbi:MAG: PH domain-containing protein [Deltaproteobacteria bacterium]|nr:PH domain-containing protein [Deltaproteobacteria bacterium]
MGKKVFEPVLKCSLIGEEKPSFSLRLWGNGGLFAGTGIFWNKKYGVFRAYVSTGERSNLILIETPQSKVILTPESPKEFLAWANSSNNINRK